MYIETQFQPKKDHYIFAYIIAMSNLGWQPRSTDGILISYHNANSQEIELQGKWLIDEKPRILFGSKFQYSSGAVLKTPFYIIMHNYYDMVDDQGQSFTSRSSFSTW